MIDKFPYWVAPILKTKSAEYSEAELNGVVRFGEIGANCVLRNNSAVILEVNNSILKLTSLPSYVKVGFLCSLSNEVALITSLNYETNEIELDSLSRRLVGEVVSFTGMPFEEVDIPLYTMQLQDEDAMLAVNNSIYYISKQNIKLDIPHYVDGDLLYLFSYYAPTYEFSVTRVEEYTHTKALCIEKTDLTINDVVLYKNLLDVKKCSITKISSYGTVQVIELSELVYGICYLECNLMYTSKVVYKNPHTLACLTDNEYFIEAVDATKGDCSNEFLYSSEFLAGSCRLGRSVVLVADSNGYIWVKNPFKFNHFCFIKSEYDAVLVQSPENYEIVQNTQVKLSISGELEWKFKTFPFGRITVGTFFGVPINCYEYKLLVKGSQATTAIIQYSVDTLQPLRDTMLNQGNILC